MLFWSCRHLVTMPPLRNCLRVAQEDVPSFLNCRHGRVLLGESSFYCSDALARLHCRPFWPVHVLRQDRTTRAGGSQMACFFCRSGSPLLIPPLSLFLLVTLGSPPLSHERSRRNQFCYSMGVGPVLSFGPRVQP